MKILPLKNYKIPNIKNQIFRYCPKLARIQADSFVRSTNSLDIRRIKDIGIKNFRLINSNSIRGVTLANQNPNILKELKESGINNIIDLRREANPTSKYANNCKKNGIEYFDFPININMPIFNNANTSKLSTKEREAQNQIFKDKLPKFFNLMNKGKLYMSCLLGLHRTDLAVTLNYLVNPKEPASPPILSHILIKDEANCTNKYIGGVKNLIKNLNAKDKSNLGLPENFQEIFDTRVLKLRMMNGVK